MKMSTTSRMSSARRFHSVTGSGRNTAGLWGRYALRGTRAQQPPLTIVVAGTLDAELLHARLKRGPLHTEDRTRTVGAADRPVRGAQRAEDRLTLDVLECGGRAGPILGP